MIRGQLPSGEVINSPSGHQKSLSQTRQFKGQHRHLEGKKGTQLLQEILVLQPPKHQRVAAPKTSKSGAGTHGFSFPEFGGVGGEKVRECMVQKPKNESRLTLQFLPSKIRFLSWFIQNFPSKFISGVITKGSVAARQNFLQTLPHPQANSRRDGNSEKPLECRELRKSIGNCHSLERNSGLCAQLWNTIIGNCHNLERKLKVLRPALEHHHGILVSCLLENGQSSLQNGQNNVIHEFSVFLLDEKLVRRDTSS